jgi:succinate dehydrogenase / fumarate reductase, cytochrome b subunit
VNLICLNTFILIVPPGNIWWVLEKQVDEPHCGQDGQVTVKKQRPVNLDLTTISMPATAKASIFHRVTGVALFFALTFVIWAWSESLSSAESFEFVKGLFNGFIAKFIAWGTLSVLGYHLIGGIRHIVMDMGHWEELESGNLSAKIAMALGVVFAVLAGVWIWF